MARPGMKVDVETFGFNAVARNFRGSKEIIKGAENRLLRDIGGVVAPALKANTPRRVGKLANSTRFQIIGGDTLEVRQGAKTAGGSFYGRWVRMGTRPHIIRPVTASALRFVVGGVVVFARKVNHPGTKPNRYDRRTMAQKRRQITRFTHDAGMKVVARLGRGIKERD